MKLIKNDLASKYLLSDVKHLGIRVAYKRGEMVINPIECVIGYEYPIGAISEMLFQVFNVYGLYRGYGAFNLSQIRL